MSCWSGKARGGSQGLQPLRATVPFQLHNKTPPRCCRDALTGMERKRESLKALKACLFICVYMLFVCSLCALLILYSALLYLIPEFLFYSALLSSVETVFVVLSYSSN